MQRQERNLPCWRCGLALLVALAGCGKTVAVKGRVTLDGKPLSGATVLFVPDSEGQGRPASGLTDREGCFQLTTYRSGDGAVPGAYRIVVTKSEAMPPPPDANYASRKRARNYVERIASRKHSKHLVPPRYRDAASTPLRCTVPAGSPVSVELSSRPK